MSVPVSQRGDGKLEAFTMATELIRYTLQITSNEKVFLPKYRSTTSRLEDAALAIGQSIWEANCIYVKTAEDKAERHRLQKEAIRKCDVLLYLITVSKSVYHLSGKRVSHWSGLVRRVKELVRAWRDSDAKRL